MRHYWAQLKLGRGHEFRNCGVSGERTDEISTRLDGDHPSVEGYKRLGRLVVLPP